MALAKLTISILNGLVGEKQNQQDGALLEKQKKQLEAQTDFYTPRGLHVYFKEPISNDEVDVEKVISRVESKLPHHLLSEVEMIIFGHY